MRRGAKPGSMSLVVIPLCAVPGPRGTPAPVVWITGVLVHMFLIGLPIALVARSQLSERV